MNKEELNTELSYFIENIGDIDITVYVALKGQDIPKKLDISGKSLPPLKNMFINTINEEIVKNDQISLIPLSSSDERIDAIYEYDLEIPKGLSSIDNVSSDDGHALFNIDSDDISKVRALLIEIGNNDQSMILYKTMASVNIYARASFFLKKSSKRFEKIDDDFFRISHNFQLLKIKKSLLVLDLKTIEKTFGFHEIIKSEAKKGIDSIEEISLIDNPETLHELIDDMTFARKLTKVAKNSPVLNNKIPNDKIIEFCKSFPKLKGRIKFNQGQDKIQLDTKVSKDLFIQLLMDNFLTSELTEFHYTSHAKDEADTLAVETNAAPEVDKNVA